MSTLKAETIHNITSYADACQAGYTGTYAQWCTLLANLGNTPTYKIPVNPSQEPTENGAVWITT